MRHFELLFYNTNTCLQKTTTCIELQEEQIFSVFFFNFGRGIYGSFSILFPEAPASCEKKIEIILAALYLYFYELKKCVYDPIKVTY